MSTKLATYPLQSNSITYGASTAWYQQQDEIPAGVIGQLDFAVVQKAGGATMSVDVSLGSNGVAVAYVPYLSPAGGLRRVQLTGSASNSGIPGAVNTDDWIATFTAADATNPRIDSVYLVIQDSTLDATGQQRGMLQVVAGVATGGATLDNRTGAGAAPSNSILLADILISAVQTTVTTAKIRDRRQIGTNSSPAIFPTSGGNPAGVDQVTFVPQAGVQVSSTDGNNTTPLGMLGVTVAQCAVAMYLPRRIVGATRIRWSYQQPATALTTTGWTLAICDSSGRLMVQTAAAGTAFTGIAAAIVHTSTAFSDAAAHTFEAGTYWVWYGQTFGTGTASGVKALCANNGVGGAAGNSAPVVGPNVLVYNATGGVTFPAVNNILGMTDAGAGDPAAVRYGVPICSLSVG